MFPLFFFFFSSLKNYMQNEILTQIIKTIHNIQFNAIRLLSPLEKYLKNKYLFWPHPFNNIAVISRKTLIVKLKTRNATRCNNRNDLLYLSFVLKISNFQKPICQCFFRVCQNVFSRFSKSTFLEIISLKFKILV